VNVYDNLKIHCEVHNFKDNVDGSHRVCVSSLNSDCNFVSVVSIMSTF
jgi:hypothetical protein